MGDLVLTVDGRDYGGWQEVRVTRAMDTAAGTFEIAAAERWPGRQQDFSLAPGDPCEVRLGGTLVIRGYVDDAEPGYTGRSHELRIAGRDATGDLVDCSADFPGGQWKGKTAREIAVDLARPFGIQVHAEVPDGDPFGTFALEQGETAWEAIERACRQRAILPMSDGAGGLLLTRATASRKAVTALVHGQNILEARAVYSMRERFRDYLVKGQRPGDDNTWPGANTPTGAATDARVRRARKLIVIAESPGDGAKLTERALWEARVRAGRSRQATIVVHGWRQTPDGALWLPNLLVDVRDPWLAIDAELLISAVAYTRGPAGTRAEITVVGPGAFDLVERREEEPGW